MAPYLLFSEARRQGFSAVQARRIAKELTQSHDGPLTIMFNALVAVSAVSGISVIISVAVDVLNK